MWIYPGNSYCILKLKVQHVAKLPRGKYFLTTYIFLRILGANYHVMFINRNV